MKEALEIKNKIVCQILPSENFICRLVSITRF